MKRSFRHHCRRLPCRLVFSVLFGVFVSDRVLTMQAFADETTNVWSEAPSEPHLSSADEAAVSDSSPTFSAEPTCPEGARSAHPLMKGGEISKATICVDPEHKHLYGPFTEAMRRRCRQYSQGLGLACDTDRWDFFWGMKIRGLDECPLGSELAGTGYCRETPLAAETPSLPKTNKNSLGPYASQQEPSEVSHAEVPEQKSTESITHGASVVSPTRTHVVAKPTTKPLTKPVAKPLAAKKPSQKSEAPVPHGAGPFGELDQCLGISSGFENLKNLSKYNDCLWRKGGAASWVSAAAADACAVGKSSPLQHLLNRSTQHFIGGFVDLAGAGASFIGAKAKELGEEAKAWFDPVVARHLQHEWIVARLKEKIAYYEFYNQSVPKEYLLQLKGYVPPAKRGGASLQELPLELKSGKELNLAALKKATALTPEKVIGSLANIMGRAAHETFVVPAAFVGNLAQALWKSSGDGIHAYACREWGPSPNKQNKDEVACRPDESPSAEGGSPCRCALTSRYHEILRRRNPQIKASELPKGQVYQKSAKLKGTPLEGQSVVCLRFIPRMECRKPWPGLNGKWSCQDMANITAGIAGEYFVGPAIVGKAARLVVKTVPTPYGARDVLNKDKVPEQNWSWLEGKLPGGDEAAFGEAMVPPAGVPPPAPPSGLPPVARKTPPPQSSKTPPSSSPPPAANDPHSGGLPPVSRPQASASPHWLNAPVASDSPARVDAAYKKLFGQNHNGLLDRLRKAEALDAKVLASWGTSATKKGPAPVSHRDQVLEKAFQEALHQLQKGTPLGLPKGMSPEEYKKQLKEAYDLLRSRKK